MTVRQYFFIFALIAPILIILGALIWSPLIWLFVLVIPFIIVGFLDTTQTKQTIRRLYPIFGRMRYFLESVRPEIQQYFVESETNGKPISREFRSIIYQRAKGARDTRPFGTIFDVNRAGYEWVNHSLAPKHATNFHPRIKFGGDQCTQPYMASPLNLSLIHI